jgi:hypothetical protein
MNGDKNQQPASNQPSGNWEYKPEGQTSDGPAPGPVARPLSGAEEVTWTASEFIARQKGAGWYALLVLGAVVVAVLTHLFTKDLVAVGAIVAVAVLFGVSASRKPRVLTYRMDRSGLTIGQKSYPYGIFKSFSVMEEGAFSSITLLPLKRFMPPLSLYYEPKDEERIVSLLSRHLPLENRPADAVERLMRHVRF